MISVIVPTKNEEANIGNCLESLVKQTHKDFEVLVCDGGSIDKTQEVVNKFSKKIKVSFHKLKPDLGHQRRFGAKNANGDYLCFIDADMILDPKVLEGCLLTISISTRRVEGVPPDGWKPGAVIIPEISFGQGFWAEVKAFERKMYIGDDRVEAARFFAKEAYQKSGGWKEGMASGEDWDLTRRVKEVGFEVGRTNELIHHNEGRIYLSRTLKRKFYYAQKSKPFVEENVKGFKDYILFVFRPAYFRNWREFIKHPVLGLAFCFMKSLEFSAGFLGMVSKNVVKTNYEKTK